MAQVGNNENRFGGPYMIQDRDHASAVTQATEQPSDGEVRQSEQSQSEGRQQGGGDQNPRRRQGSRRRQSE